MRRATLIIMAATFAFVSARGLHSQQDETHDRILASQLQCPFASAVVFFSISTKIIPSSTSQACSTSEKTQIALFINNKLLELGLDANAGNTGDESTFLAAVCPASSIHIRRHLQTNGGGPGFIYTGGGACRFCNGDNDDGGRRSRSLISSIFMPAPESSSELEFNSNIAPIISGDLKSVLMSELSTEFPCVGTSPSITATVQSEDMISMTTSLQCLDMNTVGSFWGGSI